MKLSKGLIWALVLLFLSPFLAFALSQFIPQYDSFIVTSGSMEPEIKTGDLLFTYRVAPEKIEVGDTITFRDGNGFTTHEVIEKSGDQEIIFRTQGTANSSPDPGTVTEKELRGKKLFSIPFMGYMITWAGTTTGMILLVIIPGTLIALMEIRRIIDNIGE